MSRWVSLASVSGLALGAVQLATAATCPSTDFCRSDTVTNANSLATPNVVTTSTGYPDNGPVSSGISFSLGDAFGTGQTNLGSADFSTALTSGQQAPGVTAPDSGWNFYDDFRFSINPGSKLDTAVISLNGPSGASISNLEVRLFRAGANGSAPNGAPTLGLPTGGALIDTWSTPFPGGSFLYTLPTAFGSGSYDLQFRGKATAGSSYGGNISFSPVPLPPALCLFLGGIALTAYTLRGRGSQAGFPGLGRATA